MKRLVADPGHVDSILIDGANRARALAAETMKTTKDIVGFIRAALIRRSHPNIDRNRSRHPSPKAERECGSMRRFGSTGTCMTTQRQSYESGHKPKCLVIVDDTAEWDRAVYYASRWAIRVGGGVVMLRVIETEDQNQQWLGVADIMRAEAHESRQRGARPRLRPRQRHRRASRRNG